MLVKKYLIFIYFVFPTMAKPQVHIDNSEQEVGDMCTLGSNKLGICKDIMDCNYAKQLYEQKKYSEIVRCGFVGKKQIVCCPAKNVGTDLIIKPTTTKLTTTKPPKTIQKSPKFEAALCTLQPYKIELTDYILNGEKAVVGEFPYQVALGYMKSLENTIEFDCGGSLIADDIVLSAAHCANRKGRIPSMVRLGRTSLDLNDDEDSSIAQDIQIKEIKIHKEYKLFPRHNDIALIKLIKPVEPSMTIEKICLSPKSDTANRNLTITGFGVVDVDTRKKSDWLQKGTVYEVPLNECKAEIEGQEKKLIIGETQFCALNINGTDGCQGDSGGPLVYYENKHPQLVGIISYGNGCGGSTPAVYTRVDKFLDWINEQMLLLG